MNPARLTGVIGLAVILAIGVLLSRDRRAIKWSVIAWGLGLQVLFAIFVLLIPAGRALFRWLGVRDHRHPWAIRTSARRSFSASSENRSAHR